MSVLLAAAVFLTDIGVVNAEPAEQHYAAEYAEYYGAFLDEAAENLQALIADKDIMALVYMADTYPVRALPAEDAESVVTVYSGQLVNIEDFYFSETGTVWYYVSLEMGGIRYAGYVPRRNLAVSDERFLAWEQEHPFTSSGDEAQTAEDNKPKVYEDIEQFPESYKASLTALKKAHPNWTFVKMVTNLDWQTVVKNELLNSRSLIYRTFPDWARNGLYDQKNWYYATETALKIYLDPRNGLTEDRIFQFEQLTYNEKCHTLDAMKSFLDNTFMNGSKPAPGMDTMTFAEMFWYIGKEAGREVSPFHLAARVLQEQGQGTSPLISGTYPGFEGYYNYFNISASGTTNEQIYRNGLTYAKNHGWNSSYTSVLGGADIITANYIKKGQDTLYLEKFNVNPTSVYGVYEHQYMQNITAPTTEAKSIRTLYEDAGAIDSPFVFKIPVYNNMPAAACSEPKESLNITLTLPEGYTGDTVWLDGVAYKNLQTLDNSTVTAGTEQKTPTTLTVAAPDKNAATAVVYKYNENQAPIGMYVWTLNYENMGYQATPQPELENLLSYHGFSIRITGKCGIRCKTGISTELRAKLLSAEGVNGYKLKEYGTVIMNQANMEKYPMIKGGQKTSSGMTYGVDANGTLTDVIYETVDNRYRYTAVLVGLPTEQFKTEFAFRGYAVLEKDGKSITLYNCPVARSIYYLASRFKDNYKEGSDEHTFLTGLMAEADALETEKKQEETNAQN